MCEHAHDNSGSHTCPAAHLSTEPSLQPLLVNYDFVQDLDLEQ